MLAQDVRKYVIQPALDVAGLYTKSADNLIYAIGLCETNYDALRQNKGPALGFFQCEPATHESIKKWLSNHFNRALWERITSSCYVAVLPSDDALIWNLRYATLICRLHFMRFNPPLPIYDDAQALYRYYKKYYNTAKGEASSERDLPLFQKAIDEGK